jgi:hypothetical protein
MHPQTSRSGNLFTSVSFFVYSVRPAEVIGGHKMSGVLLRAVISTSDRVDISQRFRSEDDKRALLFARGQKENGRVAFHNHIRNRTRLATFVG